MIPDLNMRVLNFFMAGIFGTGLTFSTAGAPVDFVTDVKPILEQNCVACHNAQHARENGKYRMDVKAEAFKPHKKENTINPGHPDDSLVYANLLLPLPDDQHM